jgi:hypothetical protein
MTPYMEKVNRLAGFKNFKSLRNLAEWMKKNIASKESWTPVNVTSFDYRPGTRPATTSFTDIQDLRKALYRNGPKASPSGSSDAPVLRLFLLEDPSCPMVELFGSRFNIDPLFFEAHVRYEEPSARFSAPRLLASVTHRQWFQLENVRLLNFLSNKTDKYTTRNINTYRRTREIQSRNFPYATSIRETLTTVWIGQDHRFPGTTIGIVLLDYVITVGDAVSEDPDSCVPTPDLKTALSQALPASTESSFENIVEMTSRYPWFTSARYDKGAVDNSIIVCPAIYAVCAEWLVVCRDFERHMEDIEFDLRHAANFAMREKQINGCLSEAEEWRTHIRSWLKMVKETLDRSLPVAARFTAGTMNTPQKDSTLDNIIPDFKRVLQNLQELETRVDRLIDRCTGEMQLAAARESLAESHNLARLTWLATIFVPLTFVTGLFSMNADIGFLENSFRTYFAAAVPVAIVTLITARWGAQIFRFLCRPIFLIYLYFVRCFATLKVKR